MITSLITSQIGLIVSFALVSLGLGVAFAQKQHRSLPPGPLPLPIIGNLFQLSESESLWLPMTRWGQKYGPVVYLRALGKHLVILNNHATASELLDKRSGIYSDRPRNIIAGEILTNGCAMALARYDDIWRRMRRACHEAVGPQICKEYFATLDAEAAVLVSTLVESPQDFNEHIRRASNSLMISLIYGLPPILDSKDPMIVWIDSVAHRFGVAARPGAYLVEFFPWMMSLPRWMCQWRTEAERWHVEMTTKFGDLLTDVSSRSRTCIATRLLDDISKGDLSMEEATWTASTLYLTGTETTSTQMMWFILAIVLHPSVQVRAQKELDRVIGRQRMPTLDDYNDLLYIRAIVKEVLRWRPATPMGIPHSSQKADTYGAYSIPEESLVIANVWGLNHDPEVYGNDSDEFRPERFLDSEGKIAIPTTVDTKDEGHVTFGFGRRACVGRYIANSNLFIQMASILWAFQILPEIDEEGKELFPDANASNVDGVFSAPKILKCRLVPRFSGASAIVNTTKEERMSASNA
ncbi:hypothetical protein ONZ45_g13113 [Pleurotus djamor]|nr:hypothetical protein ONZ45_g13113 [Pleurotus djamor]